MLLFIDADGDHSTGWEGYDLLVNESLRDGRRTRRENLMDATTGGSLRRSIIAMRGTS